MVKNRHFRGSKFPANFENPGFFGRANFQMFKNWACIFCTKFFRNFAKCRFFSTKFWPKFCKFCKFLTILVDHHRRNPFPEAALAIKCVSRAKKVDFSSFSGFLAQNRVVGTLFPTPPPGIKCVSRAKNVNFCQFRAIFVIFGGFRREFSGFSGVFEVHKVAPERVSRGFGGFHPRLHLPKMLFPSAYTRSDTAVTPAPQICNIVFLSVCTGVGPAGVKSGWWRRDPLFSFFWWPHFGENSKFPGCRGFFTRDQNPENAKNAGVQNEFFSSVNALAGVQKKAKIRGRRVPPLFSKIWGKFEENSKFRGVFEISHFFPDLVKIRVTFGEIWWKLTKIVKNWWKLTKIDQNLEMSTFSRFFTFYQIAENSENAGFRNEFFSSVNALAGVQKRAKI